MLKRNPLYLNYSLVSVKWSLHCSYTPNTHDRRSSACERSIVTQRQKFPCFFLALSQLFRGALLIWNCFIIHTYLLIMYSVYKFWTWWEWIWFICGRQFFFFSLSLSFSFFPFFGRRQKSSCAKEFLLPSIGRSVGRRGSPSPSLCRCPRVRGYIPHKALLVLGTKIPSSAAHTENNTNEEFNDEEEARFAKKIFRPSFGRFYHRSFGRVPAICIECQYSAHFDCRMSSSLSNRKNK